MTEPTRWSRSDSEVDPVLRATLRYARDLAPSNVEMQVLLRRLDDTEVTRRLADEAAGRRLDEAAGRRLDEAAGRRLDEAAGRRLDDEGAAPRRLRLLPSNSRNTLRKLLLAAVVTVGFGGMAWAAYVAVRSSDGARNATMEPRRTKQPWALVKEGEAPAAEALPIASSPLEERPPLSVSSNTALGIPRTTDPRTTEPQATEPQATEPQATDPQTTATAMRTSDGVSKTTDLQTSSAESASRRTAMAASMDTEASPEDDTNLLRQARAVMVGTPGRALSLLQTHAKRFPRSELSEERAELQIEVLHRLGRFDEAKRTRAAFESRFPNSPYRRRLRALMD